MIHVVPHTRAALYADQFREMNDLLHRVHLGRRQDAEGAGATGTQAPSTKAHQAIPADTETSLAIYLMRLLDDGALLGAVKLNPSEFRAQGSPHSLGHAMQALPSGAEIWDVSHFCLRDTPEKKRVLSDMMLGLLEFSLTWGIKQLNFLIDEDLQPAVHLLPLAISFIGDPVNVDGDPFVPATLRVSQETLHALRTLTNVDSPTLHLSTNQEALPSSGI